MEEVSARQNKFLSFFKKTMEKLGLYILYVACVFAIFIFALKQMDVYPFSEKTISNYDYLAQIGPYLEHIRGFLKGKNSLFYSYNVIGGADLFQTLAFLAISPFTPLLLIGSSAYTTLSFVLPLKICAIGCSAIFYFKKRFPSVSPYAVFCVATLYGVCGYVGTSNTYINWMDFLFYIPLVALGFKKMINGSCKLFSISLACMIYTCFSISSFSLFLIFPILFFYCFIVVEKSYRKRAVTNLVLGLLYAVLISLPLLIPTLISSSGSSRSVGIFDNMDQDINRGIDNMFVKLSYVLSDTFLLIFGLLYVLKYRKEKLSRFLVVAALIVMAPVIIDESCHLLNMGSYNHYALRFGFLNSFFALFTCGLFLEKQNFNASIFKPAIPKADYSQQKELSFGQVISNSYTARAIKANKSKDSVASLLALVVFTTIVCYLSFKLKALFEKADSLYTIVDTDRTSNSFTSHYAHSEGGFNVIAWLFLFAFIIAILAYFTVKKKLLSAKVCSVILAIFCLSQSAFVYFTIIDGNTSTLDKYSTYQSLTSYLKENENDFNNYRVADYKDYCNKNVGLLYDVKAFSVFSSNIDATNMKTAYNLNYIDKVAGTVGVSSGGKAFLGDFLLGNKYIFVNKNDATNDSKEVLNSIAKRKYVSSLYVPDDGKYAIYENTYALPTCFTFKSDLSPNLNTDDYFESMQNLYSFLYNTAYPTDLFVADSSKLFTPLEVTVTETNGSFKISHQQDYEGEYFICLDFPKDYIIYKGDNRLESNKIKFGYSVAQGGTWSATIRCENKTLTKEFVQEHCRFMVIEYYKLKFLKDHLNLDLNTIDYKQGRNGISFTVEANSDNQYVYLSNVVLKGHKVTINGKKASFIDNKAGLMIFKLKEGKNSVRITYTSPYPIIACVVALVSVLAILGLTVLRRKTRIIEKCETALFYASALLCVALIGFFIVYPLCLFVQKSFLNVNLGRFISRLKAK